MFYPPFDPYQMPMGMMPVTLPLPQDVPPHSRLFVACSRATPKEALEDLFAQYGRVEQVKMVTDRSTGAFKGSAFVKFERASAAATALEALHGHILDDVPLKVTFAEPKGCKPSESTGRRTFSYTVFLFPIFLLSCKIAAILASLQIDTTPPPPSPAISVATLSNARMMPLPYQLFPARFVLFLPLRSPLSLPHPFQLFAHPVIAVLARGHLKRTSPSSAPSPPLPPSYPAVLPRLAPRWPFLPRFPFRSRPEGVRQRC